MAKRRIIRAENLANLSRFTIKTKAGITLMDMPVISLFHMNQLHSSTHIDLNAIEIFVDGKKQILWEDEDI